MFPCACSLRSPHCAALIALATSLKFAAASVASVALPATQPARSPAGDAPPATTQQAGGTGSAAPLPILLESLTIIGSKENLERIPGSGTFIDATDIRTFGYDDLNQVVRRTPGVYIRQEDGYGLFPNVSLRGVSTTRNGKISVMEDGILMAPAAYSDPAAYYTPNTGRMSGLEILKGSSQIKYGPETTGGVINYLSTAIPERNGGRLSSAYGSDGDFRLHVHMGGRIVTSWGTASALVEHVHRQTDGFKTIDDAPGAPPGGSDRTGFKRSEPLAKLRFDFNAAIPQSLELKYGRTDISADETYLGLTDADFRAAPTRRYAASRFDYIDTEQERFTARYSAQPAHGPAFSVTAYRTDFARNWYKLDAAGVGPAGGFLNLSEALAGQHGSSILDVLKATAPGRLRVRANNRTYGAEGVEVLAQWDFQGGTVAHRLETGARFHRDFADRFQWDDIYTQSADGGATRTTAGIPGTQENRRGESAALALYVQDRLTTGRLTVTPGLRFESITYADIRRSTATVTLSQVTQRTEKRIDYFAPGIGATWQQSPQLLWLAGVHRGISPPGPGSAGNSLTEETSLGFEAGFRHNNRRDLSAEFIAFHTAFKDLIVEANAGGGGGVGQTSNIGKVNTSGIELALAWDPSRRRGWTVRNPWHASFTWTRARLGNDVNATGSGGSIAESIFSGGRQGNKLPYIPEYQLALGTALETNTWSLHLDAYFQPATWASANNSPALINPDASPAAGLQPTADSRYGRADAFFLVDVAMHYPLTDQTHLKLALTNVLDWEYIASRVPIGPRPGAPRTVSAGVEVQF